LSHHVAGRPAIIVQILIRRDAEVKFVSIHAVCVPQAKPKPDRMPSFPCSAPAARLHKVICRRTLIPG
jgi:hypothetical protein